MYLKYSGTAVKLVGSRDIFGWIHIQKLGVAGDIPAALVDSNWTKKP